MYHEANCWNCWPNPGRYVERDVRERGKIISSTCTFGTNRVLICYPDRKDFDPTPHVRLSRRCSIDSATWASRGIEDPAPCQLKTENSQLKDEPQRAAVNNGLEHSFAWFAFKFIDWLRNTCIRRETRRSQPRAIHVSGRLKATVTEAVSSARRDRRAARTYLRLHDLRYKVVLRRKRGEHPWRQSNADKRFSRKRASACALTGKSSLESKATRRIYIVSQFISFF